MSVERTYLGAALAILKHIDEILPRDPQTASVRGEIDVLFDSVEDSDPELFNQWLWCDDCDCVSELDTDADGKLYTCCMRRYQEAP